MDFIKYNTLTYGGNAVLPEEVAKWRRPMPDEWREKLPAVLIDLYQEVSKLGGTISGEHGVGSKRATYLPLVMDETLIALQWRIKQAFDPNNILNPGKIFP